MDYELPYAESRGMVSWNRNLVPGTNHGALQFVKAVIQTVHLLHVKRGKGL
jgi:hypothetical protein